MNYLSRFIDIITLPIRAIFSAPMRLISAPKRLWGMSLPARVAILLEIFLVVGVIIVSVAVALTRGRADLGVYFSARSIIVVVVLLIVIPFVVYKALQLWLEGDYSQFPDIDKAWKAGLPELEEHGIDLQNTPLFFIVGCRDDAQAKSLFNASRLSLRVKETPPGPQPIQWYANPDGIFLVLGDTCQLSALSKKAVTLAKDLTSSTPAVPVSPQGGGQDMLRGTIVPGAMEDPSESPAGEEMPAEPQVAGPDIRGTMVVGGADDFTAGGSGGGSSSAAAPSAVIGLSPAEAKDMSDRLEYICHLLRRARQPLCPCNGILTVLPFELIAKGAGEGIQVQRAVKADLATFRKSLKLRCPVTALVAGMETQTGFRELVRRVGPDRAKVQRFGKGFNIWNPPIPEQIEAVAIHACGAFEDWAYTLFKEKDGLNKPGNTKLYALLCNVRSNLRNRLKSILVAAYAHDRDKDDTEDEGLLFSGCYFAATGETEDRQAFVKSVFDKLIDEEEQLDWTDEALDEDDRYQGLARFGMVLNTLLAVALVALIVMWFRQG